MGIRRTTSGFLLLLVLAGVGYLLVVAPTWVLQRYREVQDTHPVFAWIYLGVIAVGGTLLAGSTAWILFTLWRRTRRKQKRHQQHRKNPSQLSEDEKQHEIQANLATVEDFRVDPSIPVDLQRELEPVVRRVMEKREQQSLEIVAFGTISSGKSSLLNALAGREIFRTDAKGGTTVRRNEIPWPGMDQVKLVDTPGLAEVSGEQHAEVSAEAAKDADLVLVVVDGPLRDSEFRLLRVLGQMEKRILVCLNKLDWYDDQQQRRLLEQIRGQVEAFVRSEDVVAVQAEPVQRPRVRVLADGVEQQEKVDVPPDISPLAARMLDIIRRDGSDLLLANLLLQSRGMVEEARDRVRASLDKRAWEIVDRYMWAAGGVAALSPLPLLDLAASGAISTKMVLDLARVYRQEVDLQSAVTLLGQLGKNLIAILGVSAATPAVATAVATLLKTVPGAGTIAGGMLQGTVQALITRWIGAVFIQYYKNEMQPPEEGLAALARREWQQMTRFSELRKLVAAARTNLKKVALDDPHDGDDDS